MPQYNINSHIMWSSQPSPSPSPSAHSYHHNNFAKKRAPRIGLSSQQFSQHQHLMRQPVALSPGEVAIEKYLDMFERQKSFDPDDDMEFCPGLDDDDSSISSSSERSSLASNSPRASPTQHEVAEPQPFIFLNQHDFEAPSFMQHQANSGRASRAVAIVNPSTGLPYSGHHSPNSSNAITQSLNLVNQQSW